METITTLVIVLLVYTMVMPFIAWIVPPKVMNIASGYMSKVVPILGLKELLKSIFKTKKSKKK